MKIGTQKIALGFAFGAFFFMVIGSIIKGTTALTALFRGFEGAIIFGAIAWFVSAYLFREADNSLDMEQ